MIPKMLHDFNVLSGEKRKSFGKEVYIQYIANLVPIQLECNQCHHRGCCIRHGHYERSYLLSPDDFSDGLIKIQRVICKDCHVTHAILPEEIVPYCQYSIVFIFLALYQYYMEEGTVRAICDGLGISHQLLYKWVHLFEAQKERFLGSLLSMRWSGKQVVQWLCQRMRYGDGIARLHLKRTEKMPMQIHRNPPNTCHPVMA